VVEAEIDENANQEIIDIEGEIVDDTGPDIEVEHEEPHPEPAKDIDGASDAGCRGRGIKMTWKKETPYSWR